MNVEFDEDNSSQAKQIVPSVVGDEAPSQVIRTMGIGHILPQETYQVQVSEEGVRAPLVDSPQGKSSSPPQVQEVATPKAKKVRASPQRIQPSEEELEKKRQKAALRLQMLQHSTDNILGSINKGVTTRKRLANFCEHHSFVSCIEPLKVEDDLDDPDWVEAMHNSTTLLAMKFGHLLQDPREIIMSSGPNGFSRTSKMSMDKSLITRQG